MRRALLCHTTPVITVKQKELRITSQVRRIRINPALALQALWKLNWKFSCETLRHYERFKSFEMHIHVISKLTAKDSMRYIFVMNFAVHATLASSWIISSGNMYGSAGGIKSITKEEDRRRH